MLPRPRPTARVVRDLDQRQARHAEKLRLRPPQLHKNGLTERRGRLPPLLNFNGVVDTPRRTRPSGSETGDDRIASAYQLIEHGLGGPLHVSRLFSQEDFSGTISLPE